MLFALCLLLSSSQQTSLSPSFFQFPAMRLVADFTATMFFTHGFFLTERPFFNLPVKKNIYLYFFSELKTLPSFLFYCYSLGMFQITYN